MQGLFDDLFYSLPRNFFFFHTLLLQCAGNLCHRFWFRHDFKFDSFFEDYVFFAGQFVFALFQFGQCKFGHLRQPSSCCPQDLKFTGEFVPMYCHNVCKIKKGTVEKQPCCYIFVSAFAVPFINTLYHLLDTFSMIFLCGKLTCYIFSFCITFILISVIPLSIKNFVCFQVASSALSVKKISWYHFRRLCEYQSI